MVDKLAKFVEMWFYVKILKQRHRIMERSERKIKKYEDKLLVEKIFLEKIRKETLEMIEKGTYM